MTDDIVARLRERAFDWNGAARPSLDMDAADEIERLRAALRSISDAFGCECGDQARAALAGERTND